MFTLFLAACLYTTRQISMPRLVMKEKKLVKIRIIIIILIILTLGIFTLEGFKFKK